MGWPGDEAIPEAPRAQVDPHICNKAYKDVVDFDEDLAQLVATSQRHTRCSSAGSILMNDSDESLQIFALVLQGLGSRYLLYLRESFFHIDPISLLSS